MCPESQSERVVPTMAAVMEPEETEQVAAELHVIQDVLSTVPLLLDAVDNFVARDQLCVAATDALKQAIAEVTDKRVAGWRRQLANGWTRPMLAESLNLSRARVDQLLNR